MKWALIINSVVHETTDVNPTGKYHPDFIWRECTQEVQVGWGFNGQTFVPPASKTTGDMWVAIKAERDRRKAGGVKVGVKWFHSDDVSRIQQMGLVMMGAGIPAGLQWKTMDGTFVAMDQTVAGNVFAAAAASDQAIFAVAEGHRVAMEASADPAAYDYSAGWPKVYGE